MSNKIYLFIIYLPFPLNINVLPYGIVDERSSISGSFAADCPILIVFTIPYIINVCATIYVAAMCCKLSSKGFPAIK